MDNKHSFFGICIKTTYIFLIVLLLAGTVSATEYYVSTGGNNGNDGLTLDTAWATPSYAATKVAAGDTINIVNGTWYRQQIHFAKNGTSEKPILIKAYNGTPTLDGVVEQGTYSGIGLDMSKSEHIVIRGLKVLNYSIPLYIRFSNNISVYDSEFSNSGGVAVVISSTDTYRTLLDNCSIHDSGWNAVQIQGNREKPSGTGIASEYITVTNNTIYNNNAHNQIDLFGNVKNVLIKDNKIYNSVYNGIYSHSVTDNQWNVTIVNNTIYNCSSGMKFENLHNSNISGNQIYNISSYGIYTGIGSDNITCSENNVSSKDYAFQVGDSNITLIKNKLNNNIVYRFNNKGKFTLQDPVNEGSSLLLTYGANTTIKDTKNQVLVITLIRGGYYNISDVSYGLNESQAIVNASPNSTVNVYVKKHPFYIKPTKYPLKVISVNSTALKISSEFSENPAWISASSPKYSNSYVTMRVDGIPYQSKAANSEGFVSFHYTNGWNKNHIFTFEVINGPIIISFEPVNGSVFNEGQKIKISQNASCVNKQALDYSIRIDGSVCSNTSSYIWNTSYSSSGNHTIEVSASDGINIAKKISTISINDYHPRWDVNKDSIVNFNDINIIAQNYGTIPEAPYPDWDVNQDGIINLEDLILAESHFGEKID